MLPSLDARKTLFQPIDQAAGSLRDKKKKCLVICLFFGFWWFLIRGIIQFMMFHWATHGCNVEAMEANGGYDYPGGGWTCPTNVDPNPMNWTQSLEMGCVGTPKDNVVPDQTLLLEAAEDLWGQQFELYHNSGGAAQITGAQKGSWYRTWGPWFWTYTYQDLGHSQTSLYMRPTLVGMMGLYSETRIMRCDGDSVWFFGEGSAWMSNRIRTLFQVQREASFKIYQGSERVGTAQETFHGTKSITFRSYGGERTDAWGSAVLIENSGHRHDLWSTHLSETVKSGSGINQLPPYYVMNAASVLMGFRWRSIRREAGIPPGPPPPPPSFFLAETPDASAGYFEEADDTIQNAGEITDEAGTNEVAAPLPTSLEDGDKISNMADEVVGEKTDA